MYKHIRLGLQFFGEPGEGETANQQPTEQPVDYAELMKSDTRLQSFVQSAADSAVQQYQQKQQKLHDDTVAESEKLKTMTAEEKAEYYRIKFEASEKDKQRIRDADALKTQTAKMLSDSGIPAEFIGEFDFETTTAETIKNRVEFLGKYEIYPKGTFDQKVNDALDAKLKQKAPESGAPADKSDNSKLRSFFGL